MTGKQRKRTIMVHALDELKQAGLLDYSIGAERADGTGPQLDIWTRRETILNAPSAAALSERAQLVWSMLLMRGLNGGVAP